jgi:type II secretory ATPase GspE/PulE/Tfp pilus assembly ATPase PilB-like protein
MKNKTRTLKRVRTVAHSPGHTFPQRTKDVPESLVTGNSLNVLSGKQPLKIGEWLVAQGWITPDHLSVALKEQKRHPKRLGELLLGLGFLSSSQLLKALSTLSGLPFILLDNHILDPLTTQQIPLEIAQRYQVILFQLDETQAHIAMADPENIIALDKVRPFVPSQIALIPYHETQDGIARAIETYYPQVTVDMGEEKVINLVNDLILKAVRLKASDVHLTPTAHSIEVHYRRDGLLQPAHTLHKDRWSAIAVRLKIMGNLDIAESRRPQNGRFSLNMGGREIDFRLSCHPTIHGENLVLRILDKTQSLRTLDELGFDGKDIDILCRLVHLPQGLIIVSGPTGSGKTTTLYALLSHMDARIRNIMTLEEPVEYYLPNIRQTEIREGGPFRFAEGVRSLLRQDPDVIFISEIRDAETAQMALRAAMTGHLVLGTIHAQDSLSVPQRLFDLGIAPSMLSGNLIGALAQRLVRQVCIACRYPKILTSEERIRFDIPTPAKHTYQAEGCPACHHTGYQGREAVAEVVLFDEKISTLIAEGAPPIALRHAAKGTTLWQRGIEKVLEGKTTFSEILRVIGEPGFSSLTTTPEFSSPHLDINIKAHPSDQVRFNFSRSSHSTLLNNQQIEMSDSTQGEF